MAVRAKSSVAAQKRFPARGIRDVVHLMQQVAYPTRLEILMLLAERERDFDEILGELGLEHSAMVDYHLRLLRREGLLWVHRQGDRPQYALTAAGRRLLRILEPVLLGV